MLLLMSVLVKRLISDTKDQENKTYVSGVTLTEISSTIIAKSYGFSFKKDRDMTGF